MLSDLKNLLLQGKPVAFIPAPGQRKSSPYFGKCRPALVYFDLLARRRRLLSRIAGVGRVER
jgi:hypothetical protein